MIKFGSGIQQYKLLSSNMKSFDDVITVMYL